MEQLSLFPQTFPYKYIIDSSSIFTQKPNEAYRRNVNKSLWSRIDELIRQKLIIICSEIFEEIHDKELQDWLKELNCVIIDVDEDIQKNVTYIVTKNPNLVDFKQAKSSGDAFLIATAMKYKLVIITEEKKINPNKIPQVAASLGVNSINLIDLCDEENWEF